MLKAQKSPLHRLPRIAWEANKKIQMKHKNTILCFDWTQGMEKWFGRWDATPLLNDASLDSSIIETLFQQQRIITWGIVKAHASHITAHVLHLTTKPYSSLNGKTIHVNTCQSLSCCLLTESFLP